MCDYLLCSWCICVCAMCTTYIVLLRVVCFFAVLNEKKIKIPVVCRLRDLMGVAAFICAIKVQTYRHHHHHKHSYTGILALEQQGTHHSHDGDHGADEE